MTAVAQPGSVRMGTTQGRWVIFAAILGSGIAFLDGTVVNVALPAIADDLDTGLSGLQWTLDAYLLTLSALLLLGGALGDEYGRKRVFMVGLVWFTVASVLCGLAPNTGALIGARALQGIGGALLVPGSLSLISATFSPADRGAAVGAWSGLTGVATAIGPFLGGWLVDSVSWRLVFLINVPLAALALWVVWRHVPESHDIEAGAHPDYTGAAVVTLGFTGVVYALIEGPAQGWTAPILVGAFLGAVALVAFPFIEMRTAYPLVPMSIFRSRQFSGANATTLAVYAGLGTATFLLVVELQTVLGYSAIEAGSSLLPITLFMLTLSSRFGALAQRIGPRLPMTIGPMIVAVGLLLLATVSAGDSYLTGVLPGVAVLGFGLAVTVAPLTTAVMSSVDDHHLGVGSGINNAVARVAGLLSVAVLPSVAGIGEGDSGSQFADGVQTALQISAALAVLGGLVAFVTIRKATPVRVITQANIAQACGDPALCERGEAAA